MAETVTIKGTVSNSGNNTLFDGDFIDLTSESEPPPQSGNEDDVVMLNDAPILQTQPAKTSPTVIGCKKKIENAYNPVIKQATMIVSSAKNSQQFLIPVKLTTTAKGTRILVQPPFGKEVGQLIPSFKGEIKQQAGVTGAKVTSPQHKMLPSGGSPVKKAVQSRAVPASTMQKVANEVGKNVSGTSTPQNKCSQKSPLKTPKKPGLKTNINPVAMQQYRTIRPAPSSSAGPATSTQNIQVEDAILLPTSSEIVKETYQDVTGLNLATNRPNVDRAKLLPSQSEDKAKSQVVNKSVATGTSPLSPKLLKVVSKSLSNNNLNQNNDDDDDVIVISDDSKKEETKKPKEIQTILTLPINALKQRQLGVVSNRVNTLPQETMPIQKKDSEKGYIFLTHQLSLPNLQRKTNTSLKIPNRSIQTVKELGQSLTSVQKPSSVVSPKEHPAKPLLKTLQCQQSPVKNKNIAANAQELEIVENEISLKEPDNVALPVSVEAIEGTVGDQPVYFLLYSPQIDQSSTKVIDDTDAENCTVIPDDDIDLGEPKVEPDLDDVCTIESDKDEDPFEHVVQSTTVAPSAVITPVDITQILQQGKMAGKTELKDRCQCISLKNMNLYQKGFTKREMKKAYCARFLQTFLKKEEGKIVELKKSSFHRSNFIVCGKTFNNFLPETSQCDEGDPEEYVIEYNNIEERLTEEIYNSQTLPVITSVISKVNEEVLQMRTEHLKMKKRQSEEDLQAKLAKPEEALKLIKRGLELIKSWSKETHSEKEKANKSLPIPSRKRTVVETKRKRCSAPIEVVLEPPKKPTRLKKNEAPKKESPRKNEAPLKVEPKQRNVRKRTPTEKVQKANASVSGVKEVTKRKTETSVEVKIPVKRGRKPKNKTDFGSVDDNELFLIKKVDILNSRKRK